MAVKDSQFTITLKDFHTGFAPLAAFNNLTELGAQGQASVMTNVDIIGIPGVLTQGPGLVSLTNGTQAGVVTELINFIMDKAVAADVTYGIGPTKLFKISSTTVASGGTPSWPQVITNCADGSSVIDLNGNIYALYNTASAGDIAKMPIATETIDPDWGSTIPAGAATLQKAVHPVAVKEDIMAFGNGRYLGTFIDSTNTLAPTKLDFKVGNVVSDVIFHANQWWIAVNSSISGARGQSQIYQYDGGAISSILSDETAVGVQRIGFIYPLNGVIYVAFQDLSSTGGYKIGYISGRQLKVLRSFTGTLPTFAQKTLYKNTIIFLSGGLVWSIGSATEQLPIQISQLGDGGFSSVGAIAAPFGTPMIASSESTSYKLAQFSGYDTACSWKSIVIPVVGTRAQGFIDRIVILTKTLSAGARCDLTIEADGATSTSSIKQITGTGKRYFKFDNFALGKIEDFRVALSWTNGSISADVAIRKIMIEGHFVEN